MQEYKHRPLNLEASEIRLLRVEKSHDESAPIILTLRHANINEDKYNALSYAWGDESPVFEIVIRDGSTLGTFHVRKNLYDYLRSARQSTDDWSSEWIWIDQIGIKQSDHEERCHQVAQMEKLYTATQATIVWPGSSPGTGCETPDAKPCFPPRILEALYNSYDSSEPTWSRPPRKNLLSVITFSQLLFLITTPYWRRLWVLQELLLAPQVSIFFLDQLWLLDDVLHIIMTANVWDSFKQTEIETQTLAADLELRLSDIITCRLEEVKATIRKRGSYGFYWSIVLALSKDANCSIPLDRVYGVLGIVLEDLRISPDYKISMMELLVSLLQQNLSFFDHASTWSDEHWIELSDIIISWFDIVGPDPDFESHRIYGLTLNLRAISGDDERQEETNDTVRRILKELDIALSE